jgi:hypothetical protein
MVVLQPLSNQPLFGEIVNRVDHMFRFSFFMENSMSNQAEPKVAVSTPPGEFEPLLPLPAAAKLLGVPFWCLRIAVRGGLIPFYYFGSRSRRVRLSEVVAATSSLQNDFRG